MERRTAEVVIVGAGIIGCSIAYNLALRGVRDVVVLEADRIARGSTAAAAGGIRLQFSTPTNIQLAQRSLEVWTRFNDVFGVDIGLRQQGYLFLLSDDDEVESFRHSLTLQQQMGVPSRWVTPEEIRALNPVVLLDDIRGGTFCPLDGWADPYSAAMGYAAAARSLGVEIREREPVVAIRQEGGRIAGVGTAAGEIKTERTVICAGAASAEVGILAGVALPIVPYRRMSFVTEPFPRVPSTIPMTIHFASSLYFHPDGPGFLFGMSNQDEAPGFNREVDDAWLWRCIEALVARAPTFADAGVKTGWAGLYEVTPDDNPLLGPIDEVEGLYVAAGFSGHGFMQGPAVGACISELIVADQATTADISAFRPGRFRSGQLAQERNVV